MTVFLAMVVCTLMPAADAEFAGWEGMRVIYQEGDPSVLRAVDLDQDGRDELIVVNTTHSRLDVYDWLPTAERSGDEKPDEDPRPNDLPMPEDMIRHEIPLKHLPHDVLVMDWGGDGKRELVVLVSPPNKVLVYAPDKKDAWVLQETIDLLPGDLSPWHRPMLLDTETQDRPMLYVGCTNGVQQVPLEPEARANWLAPREQRGREDWWLADIDGDGHSDLVERARESHQSMRWLKRVEAGHLTPARVLLDQPISEATVFRAASGENHLVILDGSTDGLLHRYRLGHGEEQPLGRQWPLAISDGRKAVWCGLRVADRPALVVADRERPQLLVYHLETEGWGSQMAFPIVNDVCAIAAPQASPGTLLLWAEGASDLHVSRWSGGRMSYPRAWTGTDGAFSDDQDRAILGLGSVGATTWWLQQVDDDCDLYVWKPGQSSPERTRFERTGLDKGGHMEWIGGQRLLVRADYRDSLKMVAKEGDATVTHSVSRLRPNDVDELKLISWGDGVRVTRLTDGVLQWLDDELQPTDQVMLPQGRELGDYVAIEDKQGWALEADGHFVHRLEADGTGIYQLVDSVKMSGGSAVGFALVQDPVLGLMLLDNDRIVHLDTGQREELELLESFDVRIDRRSGVKQATIHRIDCLDLNGDGSQEVLLFDDRRHQLTVLGEEEGKLKHRLSWPVFEDQMYPYGDDGGPPTHAEPRTVVAWDADADGHRDLAMLCHDRLLIYFAREIPED